jgi:hypothetical protein
LLDAAVDGLAEALDRLQVAENSPLSVFNVGPAPVSIAIAWLDGRDFDRSP